MKTLRLLPAATVSTVGLLLGACGGSLYAMEVNGAASRIEQARELGADHLAPFEYYFAVEHLTQAKSEAAEGDYSDAIDFAAVAQEYAEKAIKLTRARHDHGAGR